MTRSKHAVLQVGLYFDNLLPPLTPAEVLALQADLAFRQAEAVMTAACLEDDILATQRACLTWWQAGLTVVRRERTTA